MTGPVQAFTVVFALASKGQEEYCARTRVAIASVRVSNPHARVVVACDRDTLESLRSASNPLVSEADLLIAVDTPSGDGAYRSRFVKTTLRSRVDGPFLYLDSDVFVRGPLDEVFALDCDIAGAPNHSRDEFVHQVWDQDELMLNQMGWEISSDVYVNGGVLFWNDTEGARLFAAEWHRRWMLSSSHQHTIRDQPAFNSALMVTRPNLVVLPHRYNAQVHMSPRVAHDAVVWHFYATGRSRVPERYTALVRSAEGESPLDREAISGLVASRDPWSPQDFTDTLARNAALLDERFFLLGELAAGRKAALAVQDKLRDAQTELEAAQVGLRAALVVQDQLRDARIQLQSLRAELIDAADELRATTDKLLAVQDTVTATRAELAAVRQELASTHAELERSTALLAKIQASKSWRLTRPLRSIDQLVRRLVSRVMKP